jgi:amino acid transporter
VKRSSWPWSRSGPHVHQRHDDRGRPHQLRGRAGLAQARPAGWLAGWLAEWNAEKGTPGFALAEQCLAALAPVATGAALGSGFEAMVEFTAPAFWLFFLLTGISLFVLRWREPHVAQPYRVPLYPLLPLLFCASCAYMLWSSLSYVYSQSFGGLDAAWIGAAVPGLGYVPLPGLHLNDQHERRA